MSMPGDSSKVYGVTVDAVNGLNNIVNSLHQLSRRPTVRIVFDEWIPAAEYTAPVNRIDTVADIMGEILDSYYMNQYSQNQFKNRVNEYLNELGDKVDIWEIGNEVNGEWLGSINSVLGKIGNAYSIIKNAGKKTALTLYYNHECWDNAGNEMFRWVNESLPDSIRMGVDYLLVSYYEDDCNNYQPNWQEVFDSLSVLFPNSKLGIGECGTHHNNRKADYIRRYYSMDITTPNYIGGYFWWYYKQDCVPVSNYLWYVLDSTINPPVLTNIGNGFNGVADYKLWNYPNPFNPSTKINFTLAESDDVKLTVFNSLGQVIRVLENNRLSKGEYSREFDASGLPSGVYYYVLKTTNNSLVNRMVLIK